MLLFVFISSFILLVIVDKRVHSILQPYVDVEVERFTNNIVNEAVKKYIVQSNYSEYLIFHRDDNNQIDNISYNTVNINHLTSDVSNYVQDKLLHLENGEIDDYFIPLRVKKGRFKGIKNGIICDISIGSLRNSTIFANYGPTIPIRLLFLGQVNCEVDVKFSEYGINNILVELFLIVKIKEQVSMPITSKRSEIVIREPISIDIIRGEIPKYFNGSVK